MSARLHNRVNAKPHFVVYDDGHGRIGWAELGRAKSLKKDGRVVIFPKQGPYRVVLRILMIVRSYTQARSQAKAIRAVREVLEA